MVCKCGGEIRIIEYVDSEVAHSTDQEGNCNYDSVCSKTIDVYKYVAKCRICLQKYKVNDVGTKLIVPLVKT